MKHEKIIKAYMVLDRLSKDEIPLAISYKLFKVKKLLQPQWDFQTERVEAIINKYDPKRLPDGSMKFKSKSEGEKCAQELNDKIKEIGDMDISFADMKKPIINLDTDIRLSVSDIDALNDFFTFEE